MMNVADRRNANIAFCLLNLFPYARSLMMNISIRLVPNSLGYISFPLKLLSHPEKELNHVALKNIYNLLLIRICYTNNALFKQNHRFFLLVLLVVYVIDGVIWTLIRKIYAFYAS